MRGFVNERIGGLLRLFLIMSGILNDLRFAWRLTRGQPVLTIAAALTVAFGVGANTAVVSVIETVLLNPLGLGHTDRVLVPTIRIDRFNMRGAAASAVEFRDIHAMTETFSSVAAGEGHAWVSEMGGEANRLVGQSVTPEFFRVFDQQPELGRFFTGEDRDSLVLSDGFWRAAFGADPRVLGRVLILDGKPHPVVGVAKPGFRFPANVQAWTPLVLPPQRFRRGYDMDLTVLARLKPGVSAAQARDRMERYVAGVKSEADGKDLARLGYYIDLDSFANYVAGDLRRPLVLLWVAAILVLLAGCANVAGLLLTRTNARRREIAIRISVGGSRWQILRQLLLESLMLGAIGGISGLVIARAGLTLLTRVAIPDKEVLGLVSLDPTMLLYGFALALGSGLLFGFAPAMELFRDAHTQGMARSRRSWFQYTFTRAQVAAAFVFVVITALLLRSLMRVEDLQPGFDTQDLTTAFVMKPANDPGFLDRVQAALASAPGVQSAALGYPVPFSGESLTSTFEISGRKRMPGEPEWHGEAFMVSPNYFETLRVPLLRGRGLAATDSQTTAPLVCVIDAQLAERFFSGRDPIGESISMYRGPARIVGVVGTIRGTTLEARSHPSVYYPLAQMPFFSQTGVIVRSPVRAGPLIRAAVRRSSGAAAVFDIETMRERVDQTLGIRRVVVGLLSIFGGITLLLAGIGVYGVIAQIVAERTQEIGVRMALGARREQILWSFLGQGMRSGVLGIVIGIFLAAYAQRWIQSMLYGIRGLDVLTFGMAGAGLLGILVVSITWPAIRAARVDPLQALRHE